MQRAQFDIEYTTSGAWQAVLSARLPRPWQLICEQAPDDSRRRVDMSVIRLSANEETLEPVMYIEVKRSGGSLKEVELQGKNAGTRAIAEGSLTGIFIMTIWDLQPLFGSPKEANKEEYTDLRSYQDALQLQYSISMIQRETPLRVAPMLPSQPQMNWEQPPPDWGLPQMPDDTYIEYPVEPDPGSSSAGADATSSSKHVAIDTDGATDELGGEESGVEDGIEPSGGKGKGKQKKSEKGRREIKVKRVGGLRTKYEFTDAKGKTMTTTKGDWVEKKSDGVARSNLLFISVAVAFRILLCPRLARRGLTLARLEDPRPSCRKKPFRVHHRLRQDDSTKLIHLDLRGAFIQLAHFGWMNNLKRKYVGQVVLGKSP
ncbi:hypothetical protein LCI18_001668 [Fusarium solani-melongenae]|uniref:Uncharacterized protein n=1 Tax=Fusarium solani subsp. cucurbitae TaxID=2747967 RepID=A0ACD3YPE5_FUSSC|nr:hypothetical protein LCI18_001668 [Fusarium solani-melongenae]